MYNIEYMYDIHVLYTCGMFFHLSLPSLSIWHKYYLTKNTRLGLNTEDSKLFGGFLWNSNVS